MDGGVVVERHLGTPQGGPLSPLLSNCVFRRSVTDRFGIVTAEFGSVTDHFGDVTDGRFVSA
jgi:hypothetical protein